MVEVSGIVLSILAAAFFGTYLVPLKRIKNLDNYHYHFFLGISVLLLGIFVPLMMGVQLELSLIGMIPGFMWASANFLATNALKYVGLSKLPIAQGIVVPVSFLWGAVFLQENFTNIVFAVLGIVLLVSGLPLVATAHDKTKNLAKGIILLVLAGTIWGTMFVAPVFFKMEIESIIFPMSVSIFLFGVVLFLVRRKSPEKQIVQRSMFSGALWSIGNTLNVISVGLIGIALAGPLAQLAILFVLLWGLVYFKEVKGKTKIVKAILGGIMLILGAVFLAVSK